MSFWTILSCCFTSKTIREDTIRPRSYVGINGQQVSALFDTGSAISLIDSRYLCLVRADQNKGPSIKLCGANGTPLTNKGTYEVNIKVNGRLLKQHVHFIENLQVPCILGMDFMKQARITIDVSNKRIKMGKPLATRDKVLFLNKDITLEPNCEKQVDLPVPWSFDTGLVEGVSSLPDNIVVMDGLCKGTVKNGSPVCPLVLANFSHLPVRLAAYSPLATVADGGDLQIFPLQECLVINNDRPRLENIDHVEKIDLSHLPDQYRQRYKSLLRANADVFSRNDLDVGHCKSLPHKVRLKDPNTLLP